MAEREGPQARSDAVRLSRQYVPVRLHRAVSGSQQLLHALEELRSEEVEPRSSLLHVGTHFGRGAIILHRHGPRMQPDGVQ